MTFAQAAKKELRNTFGPQWVSKATTGAVTLGMLVLIGYGAVELISLTQNAIIVPLETMGN